MINETTDNDSETIYLLEQRDNQWEIISHTVVNGGSSSNRRMAVSPDGKQLAVPLNYGGFRIYSLGGGERAIYPFTTVRDAAEMDGFVGLGFTQEVMQEGEQGTADIMFE